MPPALSIHYEVQILLIHSTCKYLYLSTTLHYPSHIQVHLTFVHIFCYMGEARKKRKYCIQFFYIVAISSPFSCTQTIAFFCSFIWEHSITLIRWIVGLTEDLTKCWKHLRMSRKKNLLFRVSASFSVQIIFGIFTIVTHMLKKNIKVWMPSSYIGSQGLQRFIKLALYLYFGHSKMNLASLLV